MTAVWICLAVIAAIPTGYLLSLALLDARQYRRH